MPTPLALAKAVGGVVVALRANLLPVTGFNLVACATLSQLLYLQELAGAERWFVWTQAMAREALGLTRRQWERGRAKLEKAGLIECKLLKDRELGVPCLHVRINRGVLVWALAMAHGSQAEDPEKVQRQWDSSSRQRVAPADEPNPIPLASMDIPGPDWDEQKDIACRKPADSTGLYGLVPAGSYGHDPTPQECTKKKQQQGRADEPGSAAAFSSPEVPEEELGSRPPEVADGSVVALSCGEGGLSFATAADRERLWQYRRQKKLDAGEEILNEEGFEAHFKRRMTSREVLDGLKHVGKEEARKRAAEKKSSAGREAARKVFEDMSKHRALVAEEQAREQRLLDYYHHLPEEVREEIRAEVDARVGPASKFREVKARDALYEILAERVDRLHPLGEWPGWE